MKQTHYRLQIYCNNSNKKFDFKRATCQQKNMLQNVKCAGMIHRQVFDVIPGINNNLIIRMYLHRDTVTVLQSINTNRDESISHNSRVRTIYIQISFFFSTWCLHNIQIEKLLFHLTVCGYLALVSNQLNVIAKEVVAIKIVSFGFHEEKI